MDPAWHAAGVGIVCVERGQCLVRLPRAHTGSRLHLWQEHRQAGEQGEHRDDVARAHGDAAGRAAATSRLPGAFTAGIHPSHGWKRRMHAERMQVSAQLGMDANSARRPAARTAQRS